jgi:type IV pilus assembly protein PilM
MAKPIGVWGIDIGQCGLKTLRCHLDGDTVVADAFDYIEYPKILSQPESNPAELIKEALEQFLSRNTVRGDRVAVSVPGQSGLARYFKPPPVDAKKIADIVKYEAKQQIPFPLEDVIWDYQRMGGGTEVDGIALETEVGLFAMKRDQVFKALQPFINADMEVEVLQLAPLSIYNYVVFDLLEKTLPPADEFDPENPPPSTVVISMGTDTTDLVITNGYRVWQRNIPLGGSHFTKQLTKELKLTFAKAEHLKRNAHQAEDPKAVFQAMRPVFNDMVTELERSIRHFQSLDRKAEIANVVILGNTVKLPGLKQYLTKHLGYNVIDFESFERLTGDEVTRSPAFKDNLLAFGTCYGLCLQGLGKGYLNTNLLPQEIATERLIRAKKPWAVATAGAFLLACAVNYVFYFAAWNKVHEQHWEGSLREVSSVVSQSSQYVSADKQKQDDLQHLTKIGNEVIGANDRRVLWLELLKAVNDGLPRTANRNPGEVLDPNKVPFSKQRELHITSMDTEFFADLKTYWDGQNGAVKAAYEKVRSGAAIAPTTPVAPAEGADPNGTLPPADGQTPPAAPTAPAAPTPPVTNVSNTGGATNDATASDAKEEGPSGPGWVIELRGYHYFNNDPRTAGANHVRQTLVRHLLDGKVTLPGGPGQQMMTFTMKELGIGYPIFALSSDFQRGYRIDNPYYDGADDGFGQSQGAGQRPKTKSTKAKKTGDDPSSVPYWEATRYEFAIQFVWQEKPLSERLEERRKADEEARQAVGETGNSVPPATPPIDPGVGNGVAPIDDPGEEESVIDPVAPVPGRQQPLPAPGPQPIDDPGLPEEEGVLPDEGPPLEPPLPDDAAAEFDPAEIDDAGLEGGM